MPPALTTVGCDPGSSTPRAFDPAQSSEPVSPEAAIIVCPCRAMREKIVFSACRVAPAVIASQLPQLVVTTWAVSSPAMRLNMSSAWRSLSFGVS